MSWCRDYGTDLVGCSGGVELYPGGRLGLDVELDDAEVVALAEHVAARLAQVAVGRGRHLQLGVWGTEIGIQKKMIL